MIRRAPRSTLFPHTTHFRSAMEESITLYRSLAEKNPASYTPDLARQLDNLGVSLSNLNRLAEALRATDESLTPFLSLAEQKPASYTTHLAPELGNLRVRLSQ